MKNIWLLILRQRRLTAMARKCLSTREQGIAVVRTALYTRETEVIQNGTSVNDGKIVEGSQYRHPGGYVVFAQGGQYISLICQQPRWVCSFQCGAANVNGIGRFNPNIRSIVL
jgi:hypothetical protein